MLIVQSETINEYGIRISLAQFYRVPIEAVELRVNDKGEIEAFVDYRNQDNIERQTTVTTSTGEGIEFSVSSFS